MTLLTASQTQPLRETGVIIRRELLTRATNRTVLAVTAGLAAACGIGGFFAGRALHDFTGEVGSLNFRPETFFPVAMVTLLMVALVYASSSLTTGVVEEKQSRVVEILLTKVGVAPLVAGKLIGVGAAALVQLLAIGGCLVAGFSLSGGWAALGIDSPAASLAWLLVWFLVGFAVYALLNTILASTVSRQEDLGQALMPLNIVQMALLVVSLWFGLGDAASSAWFRGLSFAPLFSSYLMPIRTGADTWELAVAALIAVASIPVLFRFATRVYAATALRTGSRISLRAALAGGTATARTKKAPSSKKATWIIAIVIGVGGGLALRLAGMPTLF